MWKVNYNTKLITNYYVLVYTHTRVVLTRMRVISTRTRLISTRRLRFLHGECDFTRRVWFIHTRE
jgi:hypothetical protein